MKEIRIKIKCLDCNFVMTEKSVWVVESTIFAKYICVCGRKLVVVLPSKEIK